MGQAGKFLLLAGAVLIVLGLLFMGGERLGLGVGRLPGDIHLSRRGFQIWIPITSSIVVSLLLTLLINLFRR